MKILRLALFWVIFCVLCIISYFSLQELHSANVWGTIGVSQAQIDPFVTFALNIIEMAFIMGCSLVTGILIWKGTFRLGLKEDPLIKFSLEMLQSWITLSGFEGSLILYAEIFSVLVRGDLIPIYFDISDIINISWVNLILVSLFYVIIGFQALRKKLGLEKFVFRIAFDTGQVAAMTILGILILVPFGLIQFVLNPENYTISVLSALMISIVMYFYYVISTIGILEVAWSISKRIEREQELAKQEFNTIIFFLQTSAILIPLLLILNLFPFPLYFLTVSTTLWVVYFVMSLVISFSALIFYHFVKKMTPGLFENFESSMEYLKYQFEKGFAVRGTMFNYPQPVGILSGGEKTKRITGRWQKVTLKMACGHCYHVFETQAFRDGSKVKPVLCPFCGSMGTTPVWE